MVFFPAGLVAGRPSSGLGKEYTGNYRDNVNILICEVTNTAHNGIRGAEGT